MPPHRELNARFKTHIAKTRRIRVAVVSVLCVCLFAGAGVAFTKIAPPNVALASVRDAVGSIQHTISDALVSLATSAAANISDALAPIGNIPSQAHEQLAAVSSLPWIDNAGNVIYRIIDRGDG